MDSRYKMNLKRSRDAQERHEKIMQDCAKKAGVSLASIRALSMQSKDNALLKMFRKAKT